MEGLKKSLVLGGSIALLGLIVTLIPWVSGGKADLEGRLGLATLFHLRGPREPPAEVMTVLIDRSTAPDIGPRAGRCRGLAARGACAPQSL